MTIFVDSAILEEVQQAASWGWIGGATTNPSLLAKSPLPREKRSAEWRRS